MIERLQLLVAERERVLGHFLESEQREIALACHSIARAFSRGGTLVAYGVDSAETDAAHVAVEFMHPVIVGKRALPALAPPNDVRGVLRSGDIAVSIAHGAEPAPVRAFREQARHRGALTIALTGGDRVDSDHAFAVPSEDPQVVQEVQETLYHVFWELVHVFFEHPGLLDDACITCGDVAIQARVVAVRNGNAVIEKDGLREEVAVELVAPVDVGDMLLCHAGVALERVE
ncbi:MAG: HypC/HybG/HupF family hydrogenase formation chaperone [Actinobacteria bacterium]|nr:HypC/HybG/HupF family hydrogenase formation chaperone [Actinomycetota bacterium]